MVKTTKAVKTEKKSKPEKVAKKVKEANVTLEELFEVLDEERKRYYKEHYVKD